MDTWNLAFREESVARARAAPDLDHGMLRRMNRLRKYKDWAPTLGRFARHTLHSGLPDIVLTFPGGGIGDDLLCTSVARELRKRGRSVWIASNRSELFFDNRDIGAVVPDDARLFRLVKHLGTRVVWPNYSPLDERGDRCIPPPRHIIAYMCELAGVHGKVELRPHMSLAEAEKRAGSLVPRQIAIQSSIRTARYPMLTKEWYPDRFQAVVSALAHKCNFVQVGAADDPLLDGVLDLRGKTSIRATAAILHRSILFVGLEGFLMHLARAVDCRSVIVYGGRTLPSQVGYSSNENLVTELGCSPCWGRNTCNNGRKCMDDILPDRVIAAVERQAARYGTFPEVDTDFILPS